MTGRFGTASTTLPGPLVSADWLTERLGAPGLVAIDASWALNGGALPGREAFERKRIPGARFFDIDAIADGAADLPHMLPSPQDFATAMGVLGIEATDCVVIYEQNGLFSSPRAWWTFRAMGHEAVAVLDGGLPAWRAAGGPVEIVAFHPPAPTRYSLPPTARRVADADAVRAGEALVLDARPQARFAGAAPEPRAGLRQGAIPGSRNTPLSALVDENGRLRDIETLVRVFDAAGLDHRPLITTCGSGVTAAVIGLALTCIGRDDWRLYDGAFAEWGRADADPNRFPVVASPETPPT